MVYNTHCKIFNGFALVGTIDFYRLVPEKEWPPGNTCFGWMKFIAWSLRCLNRGMTKGSSIFAPSAHESRFVRDPHIKMTLCQILPGGSLDKYLSYSAT